MDAWHVLFAVFSAFGLFTFLWAVLGLWLPRCEKGWILCPGPEFVPVYLWLRGLGIVTCPMKVLGTNLSPEAKNWLIHKEIQIIDPDTLDLKEDIP